MGSIEKPIRVSEERECVQEMVNMDPSFIPHKYLRSEEERAKDIVDISLKYSSQIPILDLALLFNGDKGELEKLDKACAEWGFFQGSPVVGDSERWREGGVLREGAATVAGCAPRGRGDGGGVSSERERRRWRDVFREGETRVGEKDVLFYLSLWGKMRRQKLDWSDSIMYRLYPSHLRKPELWPAKPPSFKDAVETYSAEVRKVAGKLFCSLSFVMGMEKEGLLELQKELQISMRVNYYPTCSSPDKVLGLSPHSDPSSITILMQNNDTVGLQIRHDGGWVPIKPAPNSLIINVGDVLEIWNNGKYKSIEHRAVTSETNTRISFGAFVSPNIDVEIEPLKEMLSMQQKPAKYKKIKYGDYLTYALRQKMDGKVHIEEYKS
ncbi:hypothetical protein LguiB_035297 [Lonicera macranthoides]